MLVLERKNGQSVTITTPDNQKIEIFVSSSGKGRTKLAFGAANDIEIVRNELLEN